VAFFLRFSFPPLILFCIRLLDSRLGHSSFLDGKIIRRFFFRFFGLFCVPLVPFGMGIPVRTKRFPCTRGGHLLTATFPPFLGLSRYRFPFLCWTLLRRGTSLLADVVTGRQAGSSSIQAGFLYVFCGAEASPLSLWNYASEREVFFPPLPSRARHTGIRLLGARPAATGASYSQPFFFSFSTVPWTPFHVENKPSLIALSIELRMSFFYPQVTPPPSFLTPLRSATFSPSILAAFGEGLIQMTRPSSGRVCSFSEDFPLMVLLLLVPSLSLSPG